MLNLHSGGGRDAYCRGRDCTNFSQRLQFFQVKTKQKRSQSHYDPSPNLFATTQASMRPFSTVAVRRRLSKWRGVLEIWRVVPPNPLLIKLHSS